MFCLKCLKALDKSREEQTKTEMFQRVKKENNLEFTRCFLCYKKDLRELDESISS